MYTTILVPVDISEDKLTAKALRHVEKLAEFSQAKVHFFYAIYDISAYVGERGLIPLVSRDDIEKHSKLSLEEMIKNVNIPSDRVTCSVSFGAARDSVLELAQEIGADLIVVGSRRPSVTTYLLGSNASAIVRHAMTSVLVVR
ncbi:universal stress protein [Edaphovirga cremea]|uniref:universal stress protein n=1 Tax=Edaphovirga cremea TaxID=2267246 RepID=UPI000DEEDA16|nr:universal stress protein [Edaphovirga cremea]